MALSHMVSVMTNLVSVRKENRSLEVWTLVYYEGVNAYFLSSWQYQEM